MKSFFITGQQRSGTTLLAVMLSRHKDVYISKDSMAFRLTSCFNNYQVVLPYNLNYSRADLLSWLIKSDYKGRLLQIFDVEMVGDKDVRSLIESAITDLLKTKGRKVFGDKAPNLHYFLGDLLKIVPDAKLLHIVRDGRATALSQHKRGFKNLLLAGQEWVDGTIAGLS
ncbi:MAG: sulfotransferase, partial [Saprospiraceae bacterium]|nr:sulfotransferase [Saprospiraceae bacterium]